MVQWNGHFSIRLVRPRKVVHLLFFLKLFRLDQTDPLSFGLKFLEILVEWIMPPNSMCHYRLNLTSLSPISIVSELTQQIGRK